MPLTAGSSLLLWLLAAFVGLLGVQVAFGWIARGRRDASVGGGDTRPATAVAAAVLGTTLSGATLLALAAEGLPYPLGFHPLAVVVLWAAAVVAGVPVAALLVQRPASWTPLAVGPLLAVLVAASAAAWIQGAGLRPGVVWQPVLIGAALTVMAPAFIGALQLLGTPSTATAAQAPRRPQLRRFAGSVLMAVAVVVGAEIVNTAAGLGAQSASDYRRPLSAALLSLLFGVALPLALVALRLDLRLRDRSTRRRRPLRAAPTATRRAAIR